MIPDNSAHKARKKDLCFRSLSKKNKNWDRKVGIFFFTNPCDIWIFNLTSFSYLVVAITKDWLFLELVSVTI